MSLRLELVGDWGLRLKEHKKYEHFSYGYRRSTATEIKSAPNFTPILTLLEKVDEAPIAQVETKKSQTVHKMECKSVEDVVAFLQTLKQEGSSEQAIIDFLNQESTKKILDNIYSFMDVIKNFISSEAGVDSRYLNVLRYLLIDDSYYHNGFKLHCETKLICLFFTNKKHFKHPLFQEAFKKVITNKEILVKIAKAFYPARSEELSVRLFLGDHLELTPLVHDDSHPLLIKLKNSLPFSGDLCNVVFDYAQGVDISFSRLLLLEPSICLSADNVIQHGSFNSPITHITLPLVSDGSVLVTLQNCVFLNCSYDNFFEIYEAKLNMKPYVYLHFGSSEDDYDSFLKGLIRLHKLELIKLHNGTVAPHNSLGSHSNLHIPSDIRSDADVGTLTDSAWGSRARVLLKSARGIQAGFELAFQLGFIHPVFQPFIARYVAIIKVLSQDTILDKQDYESRTNPLRDYATKFGLFKHRKLDAVELLQTLDAAPVKSKQVIQLATDVALEKQKRQGAKIKEDERYQVAIRSLGAGI